jgi:protein TonB
MFDQYSPGKSRKLPRYTAVSIVAHAVIIALFLLFASYKVHQAEKKEVEVSFIGPGKGKGAPPPPPPPPASRKSQIPKRTKTLAKVEIPKTVLEQPRVIEQPKPPDLKSEPPPVEDSDDGDDDSDDGVRGGVEGGVKGGVVGGIVGGTVGGTGGGGSMQPTQTERPKAKNVPPFVIAKDMLRQAPPRMNEVFRQGHRGQTVSGLYKVCVDTTGEVYEVTPVKAIDGATDEIVEGIKADWLYRPQQVPVCFLYNMVVTVQQ